MANRPLQIVKTVSALPIPLAPNVIYLVRVGQGCDLYVTDTTGSNAYKINVPPNQLTDSIANSDINVLLPPKIGASQKWYQSGLRHGADYPYPYIASATSVSSGIQYFVPFTALEDATITALEIFCSTAQVFATISLGIYTSDSDNDVANPLFTSAPIACSATGAKNAPCNVQIKKGKVYWLSSLPIGTPAFYRNNTDSLFPIKGSSAATQAPIIGYYTTGKTIMAQSAPTNKLNVSIVPRVMFVTS